jgi:hypothetical protein
LLSSLIFGIINTFGASYMMPFIYMFMLKT